MKIHSNLHPKCKDLQEVVTYDNRTTGVSSEKKFGLIYRKIPKISPGAYINFLTALFEGLIFGGVYIRRGLSTEENMRFKIDLAGLIFGSKFIVFALFYLVFRGQFSKYKPPRGLYLEGRFSGEVFALPVWGAYIWRGLFSEFYGAL